MKKTGLICLIFFMVLCSVQGQNAFSLTWTPLNLPLQAGVPIFDSLTWKPTIGDSSIQSVIIRSDIMDTTLQFSRPVFDRGRIFNLGIVMSLGVYFTQVDLVSNIAVRKKYQWPVTWIKMFINPASDTICQSSDDVKMHLLIDAAGDGPVKVDTLLDSLIKRINPDIINKNLDRVAAMSENRNCDTTHVPNIKFALFLSHLEDSLCPLTDLVVVIDTCGIPDPPNYSSDVYRDLCFEVFKKEILDSSTDKQD